MRFFRASFILGCLLVSILVSLAGAEMSGADYLEASAAADDPRDGVVLATKALQAGDLTGQYLAQAYYNRGYDYLRLKKYNEAIADFTTAVALQAGNHAAYNGRGECWRFKGRLEKALSDFNKAIEIKKDYAFAYWNRSLVYENQGRFDLAARDVERFNQLEPEDPFGPQRLGRLSSRRNPEGLD